MASSQSAERIVALVREQPIDLGALEEAFDEASHSDRIEAIRQFTPKIQRRLFDACQGRKVDIDQIVPAKDSALQEVIHWGQNTLPAFRDFQKRFCRPSTERRQEHPDKLWGYNHQRFSPVTGPGYFVAYDDEERGEVVIDYHHLPPERPERWPEIRGNDERLGRVVYHKMRDRLRRVSEHVTIGRAFKKKPMNAWFVLVREDR